MKRVLVTGATGFIGSHLVERLARRGVFVRCLVRKTSNLRWLQGLDVEYAYGDITEYGTLTSAVTGVDTVFHLGGMTKAHTEEELYLANANGTVNLIKAVVENNPRLKRFVYVSSQAAAGPSPDGGPIAESDPAHPITPYGESKLSGEEAVLTFHSQIPVTIVRPSVVYGPRDTDIYIIFRFVSRGVKPVIGWRKRYVSLIYIDDLVEGILLAAEKEEAAGQIYFLVSDPMATYQELDRMIAGSLKKKAVTVFVPIGLFKMVVAIIEMIFRMQGKLPTVNRRKVRDLQERYWICDGSKARDELGFRPRVSLHEGIERSVAWYRDSGWL